MIDVVKIVIGFDQVEAIAYHTFCQGIIDKSSMPVQFIPLAENTLSCYRERHNDGSNRFIYSRFLTPYINNFSGWAIFADGDMVCQADIKELWNLKDQSKAVMLVKHSYISKVTKKYLGNKNENYPRKNWSSLILWNCGHPINKVLTPEFISLKDGPYLHRFSWIPDELVGEIPMEWNWLASEYEDNDLAKIIHYTLGTPCFQEYKNSPMSKHWHYNNLRMNEGINK